ncbi:hypothetical protein BVY04_01010 [bacterium M21]|nr:hypothetical protein BVY04_01010 [bacterium M21]
MNKFIEQIFRDMAERNIEYCHWKSNNNLADALDGIDDLDILVGPESISLFSELLASKGFRLATDTSNTNNPFVFHFYGMDPDTGLLVHFHVYYRFVTGGSILKNHWIPVERMFLSGIHQSMEIPTPAKEADLILFVIRKFIEQPSIVEHFLFRRDYKNIKRELNWLLDGCNRKKIHDLLTAWVPSLSVGLFDDCLDALESDAGMIRRIKLGCRVRRCFTLTVRAPIRASVVRSIEFFRAYIKGKLKISRKDRILFPGGRLVAFVGSEASGKSTLSAETAQWFNKFCDIHHVHLGKPPKTIYTRGPYFAIKCYSICKKIVNLGRKRKESAEGGSINPQDYEPHPVVAVLDAIDRYQLLLKCVRKMMKGTIVITDRYPAIDKLGLDGARIIAGGRLRTILAKIERRVYARMPVPDLVFKVMAPLDLTLKRNSERIAPEPENFVRFRYEQAKEISFNGAHVINVDTTESLEETALNVKWSAWTGKHFRERCQ